MEKVLPFDSLGCGTVRARCTFVFCLFSLPRDVPVYRVDGGPVMSCYVRVGRQADMLVAANKRKWATGLRDAALSHPTLRPH